MPRHSFVRHIKLGDVKGRIDYIQNPKRQEHLYAAYDTAPETFWPLLAKQNRFDHRRSGTRGDCIEARELMIALPEALQEKDPDGLLKLFTDAFKEKYGVECVSALHHNKAMTNYHIHLIYSERKLKDRVEEKVIPVHVGGGNGDRFRRFAMRENDDVRAVCVEKPIFGVCAVAWFHEARDPESVAWHEVRIIGWADVEDWYPAAFIPCDEGVASVDW